MFTKRRPIIDKTTRTHLAETRKQLIERLLKIHCSLKVGELEDIFRSLTIKQLLLMEKLLLEANKSPQVSIQLRPKDWDYDPIKVVIEM